MTLQELMVNGEQFFDKRTGELVPNVVPVGMPIQILVRGHDNLKTRVENCVEAKHNVADAYVTGICRVQIVDPYSSMRSNPGAMIFAYPCQFYRIPE